MPREHRWLGNIHASGHQAADKQKPESDRGDTVIIANPHTVTLTSNTGGLGCNLNITINNGGTLDLGGFELNYSGNNTTFTNNGTFANSGAFNRLVSANLGANFTFAGAGIYSGNLKLEDVSANWNIAAGTTFTFNSGNPTINPNIQIDAGLALLNVTNALTIIAPTSGNYIVFDKAGSVSGAGGIKTQGNVKLKGTPNIPVPIETVSGTAQGEGGPFSTGWKVDNGASLKLSAPLTVSNQNGGTGFIIQSGASVDLAGRPKGFCCGL